MKAMILAAGLGTRLRPFTANIPKPLFPVAGRPLLDIIIRSLQNAGCKAIIINTHHLYKKIDSFLASHKYSIPVFTRYEPFILGTGGAIKNAADFWDDQPFMVINSDILTDIDLREVYDFHLNHKYTATLVLYDYKEFNNVLITKEDFIKGFDDKENNGNIGYERKLAFTGIQVLDPDILDFIPDGLFSSIIDAYRKLIFSGQMLKAFISKKHYWKDIGTPESYREAVINKMASEAFKQVWPDFTFSEIKRNRIRGDGSERRWYRITSESKLSGKITSEGQSEVPFQKLIIVDHGIRTRSATSEADSFIAIGRHLYNRGIPVPKIHLYDNFSGLVFLEDLGDVKLQKLVLDTKNPEKIANYYKKIVDLLIKMSILGVKGFDISWTYQTPYYSKDLILEKECRYFVDSFLRGYLGMDYFFEDFKDEFESLAEKTLKFPVNGFMHRDLQSRNIMVKDNKFYIIDFQGGRIGPVQYDLASLLIDPYVDLPYQLRAQLVDYCIKKLPKFLQINEEQFRYCFKYCSLTRNLQILGAFGNLIRVNSKSYFEQYIPAAIKTLKYNLSGFEDTEFPGIKSVVNSLVVK
ncbi:MAG: phosphotransferase [Desulfobacteraceae bacterium]|nr:phosphotransferase [Pseudomonadota bacterium]MBU4415390.1 phosphotransferase [Pseudomonadota bacterium]MCG2756999.1 phosphotransferase [Desulfobacteraceae bacterium]